MELGCNAHLSWEQRLALILPLVSLAWRPIGERRRATPRGLPITLEQLAVNISRQSGVGRRSLWRWFSCYRSEGPLGLARSPRRDCGSSRFFAQHPDLGGEATQWLAAGRSAALVHLLLRARCAANGIPCCGIKTVRRQAARLRAGTLSRRVQ